MKIKLSSVQRGQKTTGKVTPSKEMLWLLYINYNPFLSQSFSHKLRKINLVVLHILLITHIIYFTHVLFICWSSCDTAEAGIKPLHKGIDRVNSRCVNNLATAYSNM